MYPLLFNSDAIQWDSFGIGVLMDAISCEVEENRNGAYELEMKYPITGKLFSDIAMRSLIVAKPNFTDGTQPFRVYNISKPLNGIVTVKAQHISYDLSGFVDAPFNAVGIQDAMSKIINADTVYPAACPFTFSTDISSANPMILKHPVSVRALLGGIEGSFLDIFGGEWHFDGYHCTLHAARGENRGVIIRYGKNLTDIRQEENNAEVYTAVYPFYFNKDTDILVTLPEKVLQAPGTYSFARVLPLDLTNEFQEAPSELALRTRAQSYIDSNNIGVPKVNLKISFIEQDSFQERVDLCDTVSVRFDALGVSASAKCIRTRWDVLKERYIEAELGSARTSLAGTIAKSSEVIKSIEEHSSQFQAIANKVVSKVTGNSGGYIVLHDTNNDDEPDELLIMDSADITQAVKIIRINNGGIAFSSNGYNGTYRTAWNIDGEFVADFIASGELKTQQVKILGDSNFSWDDANITMVDPSNSNRMIRFGKFDGTHYGLGFSIDGGSTWESGFDFNGIRTIGGVSGVGKVEIGAGWFEVISNGSIAHIGQSDYCYDEDGNRVTSNYYRLGTYTDEHGIYCVSAGYKNNTRGAYSIGIGYKNVSTSDYSIAIGNVCKATNRAAIAMGDNSEANNECISIGCDNKALGFYNVAIGAGNTVYSRGWGASAFGGINNVIGDESENNFFNGSTILGGRNNTISEVSYACILCGLSNTASGNYANILGGNENDASGAYSQILGGNKNDASGAYSQILGGSENECSADYASILGGASNAASANQAVILGGLNNIVSGIRSLTAGHNNNVSGNYSTVFGHDNSITEWNQFVCGFQCLDVPGRGIIFVIGNGNSSSKSNAFTVSSGGNAVLAGTLTQNSDRRLKTITGEAPDLSGVHAVRFKWNDKKVNGDKAEHIGYIAQDVEAVAPYLVQDDGAGYKTLDYIAVLCAKVELLEKTVVELKSELERRS